jgi:hypothetical protein
MSDKHRPSGPTGAGVPGIRPARLRLSGPRQPFVSGREAARISFAWLDGREPVIFGTTTPVIVWPTDARGFVDVGLVRAGNTRVTTWTLSDREVDALRELFDAQWDFAEHDLIVSGGPSSPAFMPTARSLRASDHCPRPTTAELERLAFGEAA